MRPPVFATMAADCCATSALAAEKTRFVSVRTMASARANALEKVFSSRISLATRPMASYGSVMPRTTRRMARFSPEPSSRHTSRRLSRPRSTSCARSCCETPAMLGAAPAARLRVATSAPRVAAWALVLAMAASDAARPWAT